MSAEHEPGVQPVDLEEVRMQALLDDMIDADDLHFREVARARASEAAKAEAASLSPSGLIILPHHAR